MIHGDIIKPSLAQAGSIKIGKLGESRVSQSTNQPFRLPQKLDHFVVVSAERDENGDLIVDGGIMASLAANGYADRDGNVRTIPVIVHSDDREEVFRTSLSAYSGSTLLCTGDGRTGQRVDDKTGEVSEVACPCPWYGAERGQVCKPHGVFSCSINLPERAIAGSVHRFRTTGTISISQLLGSLITIQEICNREIGTMRGVPLVLRVGPRTVSPGGKKTTVYVVWAELRAESITRAQQAALTATNTREALGLTTGPMEALPAPVAIDDPIDVADVSAEFYPEPEPATAMARSSAAFEESIEQPDPEPPETPMQRVTRIAKSIGATKEQISAAIRKAKASFAPKKSADWSHEDTAGILAMIKASVIP